MSITETTIAATRQHDALADRRQIGQQCCLVLVVNLSADWHFENHVGAIGAMAILAHAGAAVSGGEMLLVAVIDQSVEAVDRFGDHLAALAAVTTIGPPNSMNFSRRNETQPLPPSPERM